MPVSKSQNQKVFTATKMHLLALLDPHFTDRNDRSPYPLHILQQVKALSFHITDLKPVKGTHFGRSLSVWAIIGSTSPRDQTPTGTHL